MKTTSYDQLKNTTQTSSSANSPLINVLDKDTFSKESIPGSQNVPFKDNANFAKDIESKIGGKDKPVTLYCASKECPASKNAATTLESAGFKNVSVYEGGQKEWNEKSTGTKAA